MMASTPCAFSIGTRAFAVSASSRKSQPWMPAAATKVSVASSVMPMKAILTLWNFVIQYGGNGVSPVVSLTVLAASHWKSAPGYGSPGK